MPKTFKKIVNYSSNRYLFLNLKLFNYKEFKNLCENILVRKMIKPEQKILLLILYIYIYIYLHVLNGLQFYR